MEDIPFDDSVLGRRACDLAEQLAESIRECRAAEHRRNQAQEQPYGATWDDAEQALRDARVRAVERADHLVTVLGFPTR